MLKKRYLEGTRICLEEMENDPRPIKPGICGTVQFVDDVGTLHCKFDDGRMLGVIPNVDQFHKIQQEQNLQMNECEEITEEVEESEEMEMSM